MFRLSNSRTLHSIPGLVTSVGIVLIALAWGSQAFCGPIHDAAKNGDLATVQILIKSDPNLVSSKDDDGMTPLHWATKNGHKEVVEFLLAHKAEVNAKAGDLSTPLYLAAVYDRRDIAEVLLAHGADPNAKDHEGDTPLHLAAEHGFADVAELLLAHGADVNAVDSDGMTPLHMAQSNVATLLRQHGGEDHVAPQAQPAAQPAGSQSQGNIPLLVPYKAVLVEKVKCGGGTLGWDWGYAVPKSPDDTLAVVYFNGFSDETRITSEDLKWLAKHEKHGNVFSVGLGVAVPGAPIWIIGALPSGAWISLRGGALPLLALVFVVPKGTKELVLTDPTGATHKVDVSNDWAPIEENFVTGFGVSEIEFLGPGADDLWTTQ
jgi:hypothetical protein